MIKFNEDSAIKANNYLVDCAVRSKKRHLIIIITLNKYIFSTNNGIQKL